MNGFELEALRRKLMYSVAEAARLVAADDSHPEGIEERSWNRWEAGKGRPLTLAWNRLVELDRHADSCYARTRDAIQADRQLREGGPACPEIAVLGQNGRPTRLVWYREEEDFHLRARVYWRPYCSVLARLVSDGLASLVLFDPPAFALWRQKYSGAEDTPFSRQAWAATWHTLPEGGYRPTPVDNLTG